MGSTETARCQACQAIVNPAWATCAACQKPLIPDWLAEYRRLYALVCDLQPPDPRYAAIHQALDACDRAFRLRDTESFKAAVRHVEAVMAEPSRQPRQAAPEAPPQPGWIVAYRDQHNRLHDGTVSRCEWDGRSGTVQLTNGQSIAIAQVTAVAKTNAAGQVVAAWDVRRHGLDGQRGPR